MQVGADAPCEDATRTTSIVDSIRPATRAEAGEISRLAIRSKAHWGYGADQMEIFRAELTLAAADVAPRRAHVLERGGEIVGFYTLVDRVAPGEGEIEHLFVDPDHLYRGIGAALLRHACARAQRDGLSRLVVQSDPNAAGFYEKQGAVREGEIASSIPGRTLPLFAIPLLSIAGFPVGAAPRVRLRDGVPGDMEFLVRLHREAMAPHVARVFGDFDVEAQRAEFVAKTDPSTHQIVEHGAAAVGCQWIREHDDALELVRLYLLPEVHGRGIGTGLVRRLQGRARERGLGVRLRVLKGNPARALYARLGFEVVGETGTHDQMCWRGA